MMVMDEAFACGYGGGHAELMGWLEFARDAGEFISLGETEMVAG